MFRPLTASITRFLSTLLSDVELVYLKINLEGCIDDEHQFKTAKCPQFFTIAPVLTRPASVAQLTETQCTPTGTVCRRSRGSIPGSAGRFRVRISGAHALRLISRAGKEGSTVSCIICDRWLILS